MLSLLSPASLITLAQILAIVASAALNLYLFVKARNEKQITEIRKERRDGDAALHGRVDGVASSIRHETHVLKGFQVDIDKRLSILETRVISLPTHNDLGGMRDNLSQLASDVSAITERSNATLATVHSIHKYLLESKR